MKTKSKAGKKSASRPEIGDEAVAKKTGKTWKEWVKALDAKGCAKLPHAEIAEIVVEKFGVGPWWSQMVTVGYERLRGLRVKHERPGGGYSVSASKTLSIPAKRAFDAWANPKIRRRWLGAKAITIRTSTPHKSLRITWEADGTNVDVNLVAKGAAKTQVSVEHSKLASAKAVAATKAFWSKALQKI